MRAVAGVPNFKGPYGKTETGRYFVRAPGRRARRSGVSGLRNPDVRRPPDAVRTRNARLGSAATPAVHHDRGDQRSRCPRTTGTNPATRRSKAVQPVCGRAAENVMDMAQFLAWMALVTLTWAVLYRRRR